MKYLPCQHCRRPALASRTPAPGILHSAGQCPDSSLRYSCKRCGRLTVLSSSEFQRLPDMTPEEIAAASCDIVPNT